MSERTIRHVKQAITEDSLFRVLSEWCVAGAGEVTWELRVLSAFVSGGGVQALEPLLDVFLADGNRVEVIFGIDRNGTDRDAIRRLYALSTAYPGQALVKVFQAPARSSIFHPKLYFLRKPGKFSGVIGSSNWTLSGLGANLESLLLCQDLVSSDIMATEMMSIWNSFAEPAPPLNSRFLRPLTHALKTRLLRNVPKRSSEEHSGSQAALWRPLSRVKVPRTRRSLGRSSIPSTADAYMVYDIMNETRSTQMQIPLAVVEEFFGVERHAPAEIEVSIISANALSQPIVRPLVISSGNDGRRLMRRLEMPTIRHLERPLTALFVRLGMAGSFAYALFPRGTKWHRMTDTLLTSHGQQGGGERRYYIGKLGDGLWNRVKKTIGIG